MLTPFIAAWFVAAVLVVCGLSHALHPRLWSEHFAGVLSRPDAGFVIGLPTFCAGVLIVLAHPEWGRGPGSLVTLIGWAWAIKGTLYLLAPDLPRRLASRLVKHPRHFFWVGLVMTALGIVVGLDLLRA
jgi:uncharacterized protein YjeT (DUF2065 family)